MSMTSGAGTAGTVTGAPCQRPGCTGHYDQDGFCDECGHKAPAGVTARPVASTPGGNARPGPTSGPRSVPTSGISAPTGAGLAGRSGGSRGSRTAARGRLGANLVEVPPVPLRDPADAVQKDPK